MLYIKGYSHAFRICNTYCFFSATIVARTRLNVTLYVHCVSCLLSADYSGELPRENKHKGTTTNAEISKASAKRHIRNKLLRLIYCKLKVKTEFKIKVRNDKKNYSQSIKPSEVDIQVNLIEFNLLQLVLLVLMANYEISNDIKISIYG